MSWTIFVYGTLKRGEPNEEVLTDTGTGQFELLGKATTLPKYPLVVASKYNIPFCLKEPGKGHRIVGEVYNIDADKLKALDELEAHPTFYCREIIEVEMASGEVKEAWIYLLPTWKPSLLEESSEMLVEYSSKGSHGREYVTSENCESEEDLWK
ncbi:hypothetical protein QR680_013376 [Steinernema hermaphroditum]|uniref:Gamma-glutamylcyclotransferase family protein n=1 Tax=Steinernema hermaphroditum TaxID=289476 RepID=A0AA39M286_9BILA|nr:hypothetical protein QR680_013376 [Steinernema hermaphroditum]